MKTGIIYLITNTVNGKIYIGQTIHRLTLRWRKHKTSAASGSDLALHRAIRKYGANNFSVEVIAESFEPFLDALEEFCIRLYCSRSTQYGYNMTPGGGGTGSGPDNHMYGKPGWLAGKTHSDETKAKLRAKSLKVRKPLSEETRRKISMSRKGQRLSEETRSKVSATLRARNPNPSPNALYFRDYRD